MSEDRALKLTQFGESMQTVKDYIDKKQQVASGALSKDLPVAKTVGGVNAGETLAEETSYEEIFTRMFNPVTVPALTNPSAKVVYSGSKLLECGETKDLQLAIEFNAGTIYPPYGTTGHRAGPTTGYSLNGSSEQTSAIFPSTVSEENNTFSGYVKYSAGEQPKDSAGNDFGEPLPEGQVTATALTFEFVNAIWSNKEDISKVVKLSLISKSAKAYVFMFTAQTKTEPEIFDVPGDWSIAKIEVLNELSNEYQDCSSEFTLSSVTHQNAGGVDVEYKRYSDNRGYAAGPRTIKITWR